MIAMYEQEAKEAATRLPCREIKRGDWIVWTRRTREVGFIGNLKDFIPKPECLPDDFEKEPYAASLDKFKEVAERIANHNKLTAKPEYDDGLTSTVRLE
jgi:hypothetical protein